MAHSSSEGLIDQATRLRGLYEERRDPATLDDLIDTLNQGHRNPDFHQQPADERARVLAMLGIALIDRYVLSKRPEDLSAAFQSIRDAIAQFGEDPEAGSRLGNDIATWIRTRGPGNNDLGVVLGTTHLYDELAARPGPSPASHLTLLGNRANAYRQLSELSQDPSHINQSIDAHEALLGQVPSGSPLRPGFLSNYGNALRRRFSMLGAASDLSRAIEVQEQAVSTARDAENEDLFHYALGLSYLEKYALTRDGTDLRNALMALEHSVRVTKEDSSEAVPRKATLAGALRRNFRHSNDVSELDRAISLLDEAIEATAKGTPRLPSLLGELSSALRLRHDSTGSLYDLQRSINAQTQLVDALDTSSPDLPARLADLAILLAKSYDFSPDLSILTQAEERLQRAIDTAGDDSDFVARCYHNLANTRKAIFLATGQRQLLEEAIRNRGESIQRAPSGSIELAARIASLAQDELDLFGITNDTSLLDSVVGRLRSVSQMQFEEELDAAGVRFTLAQALARRSELTASMDDLLEAQTNLATALQATEASSAPMHLLVAVSWAYWAQSRQSWHEAAVAFRHALDAADEIVNVQPTLLDRANRIENLKDLHVYASHALFKDGAYVESLMALERGRARLLNQIRSVRAGDLARLALKDPELAKAAAESARKLDEIYKQEVYGLAVQPLSTMHHQLSTLVGEWDSIASRIRQVEGLERFAEGPKFDDVAALASIKPIVYITPCFWGGLALIVTASGDVEHLTLPDLSTVRIHQMLQRATEMAVRDGDPFAATDQICEWLWPNAMGPLIHALASLRISDIFIVPVGILGVLPLHAAWATDPSRPSGRLYALDHLTISYVPSAKSTLDIIPATSLPLKSITVIEDPTSTLQYAPKESGYIIRHFDDVKLLGGDAATKAEVLKQINSSNVLHFSCHGRSEPGDPMRAALAMALGEVLAVSDIHQADLANTRMVTLSACESGLIGRRMMDELLGFATAWMGLGVPCVLSAIWSVDDEGTSHLMRLFYDNLMTHQLRPDEALRQAQVALRDGAVPNRSYAHPYYWAAFSVTGY